MEGYDLPKDCHLQPFPEKKEAKDNAVEEVPMLHVLEGKKPPKLPPLTHPHPNSGGIPFMGGAPGLMPGPILLLCPLALEPRLYL